MKTLKNYLLVLLTGLVVGGATIFFLSNDDKEPTISRTVILERLEKASELITTKYYYSEIGDFDKSLDLNGWDIPLTKKFFILTYEGVVDLGVDLSQAKTEIKDNTIRFEFPEIQILNNTIDESSIEIYDESKNVFNPISIEDYKKFAIDQKKQIEKDIRTKKVYDEAKKNTIHAIQNLFPDYEIEVHFKK